MTVLSSRWFKLTAIIVTLCLVVLVGTPFLIQYLAKQWLLENGGEQVRVQDVDFNPFTGILVLEGLDIQVNAETTLSFQSAALDLAWLPLLQKKVDIQSVELAGFNMIIDNRAEDFLSLGGIRLPKGPPESQKAPAADSGWNSGIQMLSLQDFDIRVLDNKLELDIALDRLRLTRFAQWTPERHAVLELAGSVNGAAVRLDGKLAPLAPEPHYEVNASISKLPLAAFAELARPTVRELSGLFSFEGNLSVEQSDAAIRIKEQGTITLDSLNVDIKQPDLDMHNQKLSMTGEFSFADSESGQSIQLASDIAIEELGVNATGRKINLVQAGTLNIAGLLIEELDHISIQEITSGELFLGKPLEGETDPAQQSAFSHTEKLQITQLSVADNLVSADTIAFQGHHNQIVREPDGSWRMVRLVDLIENLNEPPDTPDTDAEKDTDSPPETDKQAEAEPVDIAINRIQATGNSSIGFSDQGVKPPFAIILKLQDFSLRNVDTRKPNQKSLLTLEGTIGKHTRVSFNGDVQPFLKPLGVNLAGKIHAMDLPSLSSYTRESLGVVLDSGTLDADLKLASKNELLDGEAELKLYQLELESVESKNSLQSNIPVPLNVALDTLRDKQNTIQLNIPVQGDMNDPKFDIRDAVNQALANGLKKGALSYLTLALQPYGTMITAAKYAGEAVTKVRLNPVEFEPGQSALNDRSRDYLSKVAQVLKDRPKLAIKLCGIAVQQDQLFYQQQQHQTEQEEGKNKEVPQTPGVDEQQLAELGKQRAAAVKDYLVEKHQIPADHLVGCQPRIETDKAEEKPRTDLLI